MARSITELRVFIAAPGGLEEERKAFKEELLAYNEMDASRRGILFAPVGWELTLGGVGRPQSLINADLVLCDYFILVLHDRWGSSTDAGERSRYSAGIEEEFEVALKCLADPERPMNEISIFFKAVGERQHADPGVQLRKVLDFKRDLERSKKHLYMTFDSMDKFRQHLRNHLAQWVYNCEFGTKGVVKPTTVEEGAPELELIEQSTPEAAMGFREVDELVKEGSLTDAEAVLARAISKGDNLKAFFRYGRFLQDLGRYAQAEVMYRRVLELARSSDQRDWIMSAYEWLGIMYLSINPRMAVEMLSKALVAARMTGSEAHIIRSLSHLGIAYFMAGDLLSGEKVFLEALPRAESLGRLEDLSVIYNGLGSIMARRGDWARGEEFFSKSLDVDEKLGRKDEKGIAYANLGALYHEKGDLDRAEVLYRKALEIHTAKGHGDAALAQYINLGELRLKRHDSAEAEELFRKGLEASQRIGRPGKEATFYRLLGAVLRTRGQSDEAEQMFLKALELEERLQHPREIALNYQLLGSLLVDRGNTEAASELFQQALQIFSSLTDTKGVAMQYIGLGEIAKRRGDMNAAAGMISEACRLFASIDDIESEAVCREGLALCYKDGDNLTAARQEGTRSRDLYQRLGREKEAARIRRYIELWGDGLEG